MNELNTEKKVESTEGKPTETTEVSNDPVTEKKETVTPVIKPLDKPKEGKPSGSSSKAKKVSTKKKPKKKAKSAKKPEKTHSKVTTSDDIVSTCLLSAIVLPKEWDRDDVGDIKPLVESMKNQGQLQALLVMPSSIDGKFTLVAGRRRLAAMSQLKMKHAVVQIKEGTREDLLLNLVATNIVRKNSTASEKARYFGVLVNRENMTSEKIAKACGKTTGYISQYLAVLKGDERLQEALRKEKIPLAIFRHINKVNHKTDATFHEKMVHKILEGLSAADLELKIGEYLTKKQEKAAALSAKEEGAPAAKASPKRGAAAHKKKKPSISIPEYDSPEVQKQMRIINKKDATEWMMYYGEKTKAASKKERRAYYEGALLGLEIATGLCVEEK